MYRLFLHVFRHLGTMLGLLTLASCQAAAAGQDLDSIPGITEPVNDVTVSASVPGTLDKIAVKEGDFVEEGSLVMAMEKRQEELEVKRRKLIWESKAEIKAAEAQMELLRIDLAGTRNLFGTTKSVSKEQLLKKELEFKQAVAEFDKLSLSEAREEIEYQMAMEQLRKREITAPLSGYVIELFRKAGEDCKAQEPLVRIADTRRCHLVCNLEARSAIALRTGQNVNVEVDAGKERIAFSGTVSFVSPVVDPASGLLKVKVRFDNPAGKIRPGVAGVLLLSRP
jgi:RND family efflux transporter MFP subunit